jgi:hypothetical protein
MARDDLADPDEGFYDEATERRIDGVSARRATRRVAGVRKASGVGAVLTGIALGLQEVFYPEDDDEIVLVVDADGEPDHGHPVILDFDPTSVHRTRAHARPWLLS